MLVKSKHTVFCNDREILELFFNYLYSKKILKKILQKNDKLVPYYGIIETSIEKVDLKKIIKKKFRNGLLLR